MHAPSTSPAPRSARDVPWWQLALLLAVAAAYESLFLRYGLNHLDEAWPLYAAMRLRAGGQLYDDVLWVFPPGHLLPAWLALRLDPPGIVAARAIYAAFQIATCLGIFALARRLMPAPFALLAALLVAVAAPRSHAFQLLFGYRYLIFSILALLAFSRRLQSGDARWMAVAGLCAGTALVFRLTPAFSVSCALGVATLAADRDWRRWLRDWSWFAAGLLVVVAPVLAWFAPRVGLAALWREVVVHPLAMLQPLPAPEIEAPAWGDRESIFRWFTALQFRAWWGLYAGYAAGLAALWIRAARRRRPFEHALLLATVIWGAVFFIRSLGRSDEAHLDSVIPPICLLLAHGLSLGFRARWPAGWTRARPAAALAAATAAFAAWVFLLGTDRYLPRERRGVHRIATSRDAIALTSPQRAQEIDRVVGLILRSTRADDSILSLGPTPFFHVLTGRPGPGWRDVVMPGTFLDEDEELAFVERLRRSPPAAVIWPRRDFDEMPERSVWRTAPLLSAWVRENYVPTAGPQRRWVVMLPPDAPAAGAAPSGDDARGAAA